MFAAVRNDSQQRSAHFATLLSASTKPYFRDGRKLYEIPVAVAGSWVKQGQRFSITAEDIGTIVLNFGKRKNEQVVIDYEHASEMPEVARGGPVPAAGWIHDLQVGGASRSGELGARVEWTPEAEKLIQSGQYRFFSPAIDWSCRDKATGEPQGATLTSGALTNHPFLEELPPIMLTEGSAGRDRRGGAGEVRVADCRCGSLGEGQECDGKTESELWGGAEEGSRLR